MPAKATSANRGSRAGATSHSGNHHRTTPASSGGKKGGPGPWRITYWALLTAMCITAGIAIYYWIVYAQWVGSLQQLSGGEDGTFWEALFGPMIWSAGVGGLIGTPLMWTFIAVGCLIAALIIHYLKLRE